MRRLASLSAIGLAWWALVAATSQPRPPEPHAWDVLIRNGRVLDGSGNPWRMADVAIRAGRIVAVEAGARGSAAREIDAAGLTVAPGFIDVHSHAADGLLGSLHGAVPLLAQGITTTMVNMDGAGPVDLAAQRRTFEERGVGVNVGLFVPHGSVRARVVGPDDRAPTADELARMQQVVREGMAAGALGLSTGLYYAPGSYATTDEVIALTRTVAEAGGVHNSHIRDEADYSLGVLAAVQETIRISEEARLPGIVTHLKALGPANWGLGAAIATRIEQARERGVQIYADQYAYEASGTSVVAALVPRWAEAGGRSALLARLTGPERARLLEDIQRNLNRRGGPTRLVVSEFVPDASLEGRSLEAIAQATGRSVMDVVVDIVARGDAGLVSFNMSERDITHLMRQPWMMTSTDGELTEPGRGKPHPRGYGAFARKLAVYAREREVVGLEHAVRSMTSLPATVHGLHGRGAIAPGAWADVVVFDPAQVRDTATYAEPQRLAEGVRYVIVNGVIAIEEGRPTRALAGRVLRRERDGVTVPPALH